MADSDQWEGVSEFYRSYVKEHGRPPHVFEIWAWQEAKASVRLDKEDGTWRV